MEVENHLVIMAGGIGSRFWPVSTSDCPKQFIDVLACGKTLLQLTNERFEGICKPENVWVVTSTKYKKLVHEQLPQLPESNILLEPCMRNTAPCIAYVSWKIKKRVPEANIIVTPSDHYVVDVGEFQRVIKKSLDFTLSTDSIITLGVKVTRPETGYGYIQAGLSASVNEGGEIKKVKAFKEKPDKELAKQYMCSDNYFWNAGIFIWRVNTVLNALAAYQPELNLIFEKIYPYLLTVKEQEAVDRYFPECVSISIDYAVLEKAKNVYVFPADFGWSDLGTWGSLHTHLPKDDFNNACVSERVKMIESNNCIVHISSDMKVVMQGMDGYIVAEKDGVLLICKIEEEQRIKEFGK